MVYIHVPFCASRCIYCDFYSTTHTQELKDRYTQTACAEIMYRRNELNNEPLQSVYIGGGTPSQLDVKQIAQILETVHNVFELSNDAEITIEANPDDITSDFVKSIKVLGINRLSLGVQSFDDEILRIINRRHSAEEACKAVETIYNCGIENINIDLIYGLPSQTIKQFASDLICSFHLPIKHLSSYALSIEEGTALNAMIRRGELCPTDENLYIEAYNLLMNQCNEHGFEHYEISNFAQHGFASRHNSGYWHGLPYLGIGPGAHSYDGKRIRRYNQPNLKVYAEAKNGNVDHNVEVLTEAEAFDELLFTSLRTRDGLNIEGIKGRFPEEWVTQMLNDARPHIIASKLSLTDSRLVLTQKGIMTSNDVISDLMRAE